MQPGQEASAMTAAATETACSLRLSSAGATLQSFSQQGAGCSVSDSTIQHLLASMRQTQEAAEQIRRQRDALAARPRQQQQLQQPAASEPRSPGAAVLSRLLSKSVRSNQMQQLASLLGGSTAAAAAQQMLEVPPGSPAVPVKAMRHNTSLADSSTLEAAAADALLDLEFAARDAGSFTENRAQLAEMLVRAAAKQQQHSQDAGAPLQLASPVAAPREDAAAAPLVAWATRRGSSPGLTSASAPVAGTAAAAAGAAAPQPDASCGAAASAPAASADSDSNAARQRLQQQLLALLSRHVERLCQADAAQTGMTQAPGSTHMSVTGAGAGATPPAAGAAAGGAQLGGPELVGSPAQLDSVPILPVLHRVQQHLAASQHDAAAAAAAAAAGGGGGPARSESSGFLHRLLSASRRLQDGTDADRLSHRLGENPGLLLRSASNITSNTALAGSGLNPESVAAVSRAALAAAAEASRVQHVSLLQAQAQASAAESPYPTYLDADLLTLFYEFKATRQQVAAILREAVEQGVMHTGLMRRLQQLRQRVTDSPSFTLPASTGAAAAEAAPTASVDTQPVAAAPSRLATKRSRDQTCAADAGAAAAADTAETDAPSSKLRRTETVKSGGSGTVPPAAAAAAEQAEPMDVSAPADSSAGASDTCKAAPADAADPPAAAGGSDTPESPAAAAAAAAGAGAAGVSLGAAAAAASDTPVPAGEGGGLLARSVECLVQVHRLTNRMLAKAVSAKKEGTEAARRAGELAAMAAAGHSTTQQLQLQVQMLQQQLQLAQLQLQARQQKLEQVHVRSQQAVLAYPQLVSQVAKSVSQLVTTASNSSLPVDHRKALAAIADELLHNCQC